MWDRPYIPKLSSDNVPWQDAGRVLHDAATGSRIRVLSADEQAGAKTSLWQLPAGWQSKAALRCSEVLQLFVIEGDLTVGQRRLSSGTYVSFDKNMSTGSMKTENGALVLMLHDGPVTATKVSEYPQPHIVVLANEMLRPTPVQGPVPGIVVKVLRTDQQSGGMTMYMEIPAGWTEPRLEHHDCVEESFKLAGEITLEENGAEQTLAAGDYFFRPPRIKHGRMHTADGTASIIRFSAKPENNYGPL
jgi:quercetin dioxygenase-like cupin family protein